MSRSRELLAAAVLALAAVYVLSELLDVVTRVRMTRYDPANLMTEVEEYLDRNADEA